MLCYPVCGGETGDPRGEVNNISAGVINGTPMIKKASTPKTKSSNSVGKDKP